MSRLDAELVARGLARSRGQARELVDAGRVSVEGRVVTKAGREIPPDAVVDVAGEPDRYVGRAAHKLVAALDRFPVDVTGRRCVDVGASTGGFTQVLLERGAAHVCAIDVGHGQLAPAVAQDRRVDERSGTNVREVDAARVVALGGPFDVLVTDLSFISLTLVAEQLRGLVTDDADLVLLVKPQFEVGRGGLDKNGVVRDERRRADAVRRVVDALAGHGVHVLDLAPSPLRGTDGNVEVLALATTRPAPDHRAALHDLAAVVVRGTDGASAPAAEPVTAPAADREDRA